MCTQIIGYYIVTIHVKLARASFVISNYVTYKYTVIKCIIYSVKPKNKRAFNCHKGAHFARSKLNTIYGNVQSLRNIKIVVGIATFGKPCFTVFRKSCDVVASEIYFLRKSTEPRTL